MYTGKVSVQDGPRNRSLDGTIIKIIKNGSHIVENGGRVYRRNSHHLAPLHHPPSSQIHQSDQSITEMPSNNENLDWNKSQVQPSSRTGRLSAKPCDLKDYQTN